MNTAQPAPAPERGAADLDAWEAAARKAFLTAYAEAMRGSAVFESFDDVRGLCELAEIEKLLYELRYELDNRPAWLRIPLQGLAAMAAKPPT
jgi:maltose alpha-D-glucosyltransferase/alpha-amylase